MRELKVVRIRNRTPSWRALPVITQHVQVVISHSWSYIPYAFHIRQQTQTFDYESGIVRDDVFVGNTISKSDCVQDDRAIEELTKDEEGGKVGCSEVYRVGCFYV